MSKVKPDGIFIIIHNNVVVYLHLFEYEKYYTYSYTCTNTILSFSRKW